MLAYSGGDVSVGDGPTFAPASSMLVVADGSGAFKADAAGAPCVHFGGITKEAWAVRDPSGEPSLSRVPYFWVAAAPTAPPTAVRAFKGEAGEAASTLLTSLQNHPRTASAGTLRTAGLFPCFTRGVNKYGAENVESDAVSRVMPRDARLYGMFAHGELGPTSTDEDGGVVAGGGGDAKVACTQHGGTTILAIHAEE